MTKYATSKGEDRREYDNFSDWVNKAPEEYRMSERYGRPGSLQRLQREQQRRDLSGGPQFHNWDEVNEFYDKKDSDNWLSRKWDELFSDEGTKRQEKAIDITNKAPSYEGEVTRGVESLSSKEPSIFDGTFEDYEKSNIVEPGDSFSLMSDEPTEDSTEKSWWGSKTDDERKDLTDIGVKLFQDMYAGPSMDKALATDTMIARMMGSPSKSKFRKGFDPYTEFREREELRKKDKQSGLFSKILARGLADKYKVNLSDSEKEALGLTDIGGEGDSEGSDEGDDGQSLNIDENKPRQAELLGGSKPDDFNEIAWLLNYEKGARNLGGGDRLGPVYKDYSDDPNRTFNQFKKPYEAGITEVDYEKEELLPDDINILQQLDNKLKEISNRGELEESLPSYAGSVLDRASAKTKEAINRELSPKEVSKEPIVNVRSSDLKNLVSSFEDVADQLALSKIHDRLKGKDESDKPDEAELAFREREVEAREEETEAIQAQNYRNMLKDRMETLFPDKYRR